MKHYSKKLLKKIGLNLLKNDFHELFRNLDLFWILTYQIKPTMEQEGYKFTKNISDEGLKRFQELVYEHYLKLPEFYYIQEAVLTED